MMNPTRDDLLQTLIRDQRATTETQTEFLRTLQSQNEMLTQVLSLLKAPAEGKGLQLLVEAVEGLDKAISLQTEEIRALRETQEQAGTALAQQVALAVAAGIERAVGTEDA